MISWKNSRPVGRFYVIVYVRNMAVAAVNGERWTPCRKGSKGDFHSVHTDAKRRSRGLGYLCLLCTVKLVNKYIWHE